MTTGERVWAWLAAIAALSVLSVAAWLQPSVEGHGTHEQIGGLTRCVWVATMDRPCPTCGMTTAFAHAANADLRASFMTQPFGSALAVLTALGFWAALHVGITGSTVGRLCLGALNGRVATMVVGALLAAWAYKLMTWPGAG